MVPFLLRNFDNLLPEMVPFFVEDFSPFSEMLHFVEEFVPFSAEMVPFLLRNVYHFLKWYHFY